jgi:hypothetical protein
MSLSARLHELNQILAAFIDRPTPGALVIACGEPELFFLANSIAQLDTNSPADRFLIILDPFVSASNYVEVIALRIKQELDQATQRDGLLHPLANGLRDRSDLPPAARLQRLLAGLLADLHADNRLVLK